MNECATNNGNCEHVCKNTFGGHLCLCKEGFVLDGNKRTCSGKANAYNQDEHKAKIPLPCYDSLITLITYANSMLGPSVCIAQIWSAGPLVLGLSHAGFGMAVIAHDNLVEQVSK